MARRVQPPPAGRSRHAAVLRQGPQPVADVDRGGGEKAPDRRHHSAAGHQVARRIGGRAGQVRMLQPVRVDRHLPAAGQRGERADMVEMPVRQHDRGGSGTVAEALGGRGLDQAGRSLQTGIDQHPFAVAGPFGPHENDVHHGQPAIGDVRSHGPRMAAAPQAEGAARYRDLWRHPAVFARRVGQERRGQGKGSVAGQRRPDLWARVRIAASLRAARKLSGRRS